MRGSSSADEELGANAGRDGLRHTAIPRVEVRARVVSTQQQIVRMGPRTLHLLDLSGKTHPGSPIREHSVSAVATIQARGLQGVRAAYCAATRIGSTASSSPEGPPLIATLNSH